MTRFWVGIQLSVPNQCVYEEDEMNLGVVYWIMDQILKNAQTSNSTANY